MIKSDLDKSNAIVKSLGLTLYHLIYEYEVKVDQIEVIERDIIEAMLINISEVSRNEILADMSFEFVISRLNAVINSQDRTIKLLRAKCEAQKKLLNNSLERIASLDIFVKKLINEEADKRKQ